MKIMLDLDGVVYNSENFVRSMAEIFDITNCGGNGIKNKNKFCLYKCYDWNQEQIRLFESIVYPIACYNCELMPCAKEVIEKLKQTNDIVVITKRGYFGSEEIELSNKKLYEDGLEFSEIYYNQENKTIKCTELNIEIAIEDNYEHIQALSEKGIFCIYFRDSSQPKIEKGGVVEVHNWGEVYRAVEDYKRRKGYNDIS